MVNYMCTVKQVKHFEIIHLTKRLYIFVWDCKVEEESKFIWCRPKSPEFSLIIHYQFPFNLPVSSWEESTANTPETRGGENKKIICWTHFQPNIQLLESNSLNHTRTHGSVMYAGCIWTAAEQKRWTLCGLIASEIMSTAERWSHYRAARTPTPSLSTSNSSGVRPLQHHVPLQREKQAQSIHMNVQTRPPGEPELLCRETAGITDGPG